jgi:hypothetical protein
LIGIAVRWARQSEIVGIDVMNADGLTLAATNFEKPDSSKTQSTYARRDGI